MRFRPSAQSPWHRVWTSQRRNLRVHARPHARARRRFLPGRDPARRRATASCAAAARALARRQPVSAIARRVAASSRCFCESGVHLEKPLEPLKIGLGGGELGLGGGDVGGGSGGLGFGLANILASRAGLQQPSCASACDRSACARRNARSTSAVSRRATSRLASRDRLPRSSFR